MTHFKLQVLIVCVFWSNSFVIFKTYSQNSIQIYVDPASAPGIKASKFIDSIDFIPLETTKESKYNNSYSLILAKDQFLTMDNVDNTLFVFDKKTGKFLYKFKNKKKRYKISSIQYVPSRNAVIIKSINNNYTISADKALKLIKRWKGKNISKYVSMQWLYLDSSFKKKSTNAPSIVLNSNITYFDNGFIFRNYSYDKYSKDSILYRIVQYDSSNQVKHMYFPYLNLPKLWSSYNNYALSLPVGSTLNESTMLFQLDYSPIIYEIFPDTIVERYRFIFPMTNVMPSNFNSLKFNNNINYEKYKGQNIKAISYPFIMLDHNKYLIFGLTTLGNNYMHFLLLNNIVYNLDKLTSDSSIYNLPTNIFSENIAWQDKSYLYAITNAATILNNRQDLLDNKNVSQSFKDYLLKMTKEDNNIIIRIKLK